MNDNLPLGAENDSRAPWNLPDVDNTERIEEALESVLNVFDDQVEDIIYELISDANYDIDEDIIDEVFREMRLKFNKIR